MQQKTNFPVMKRAFYAFKIEGEKKLFGGNEEDIIKYLIQYYKTQFKAYPIVKWFWMIQFEDEYFGFQTIFTLKKQYSLIIKNFIEINGEVIGITDLTSESKPLPFISMIKKFLEFAIENEVQYSLIDDNTQKLKQEETKIKERLERKKQGLKKEKKQKKKKNDDLVEEIKVEETKMEEEVKEVKEETKMEEEIKEIKMEETKMEEESYIQIIKEEPKSLEEIFGKTTQIHEEEKMDIQEESKSIPLKRKSLLSEIENPLLVKERERKEEKKPIRVEEVVDNKTEGTKKKKRTKKSRVKTKKNQSEDELEKQNDVEQNSNSKNQLALSYWWNIENQQLKDLKERICQIIQNKKCLFIVCKEDIEEKLRTLINERLIEKEKIIYCESLLNICQEEENKVLRIFETVSGIDFYSFNKLNFGYMFQMNFREHKPIGSLFIVKEKQFEEIKQVVLIKEDVVCVVDDKDCIIEKQETDHLLIDVDSIEPQPIQSSSLVPLFPSVLPDYGHNQELNSCLEPPEKDEDNDVVCVGANYNLNESEICKKESFDDVPF